MNDATMQLQLHFLSNKQDLLKTKWLTRKGEEGWRRGSFTGLPLARTVVCRQERGIRFYFHENIYLPALQFFFEFCYDEKIKY